MDDDITTLDDAQLVQLLKEHRQPNGDFNLPLGRCDELTKEERDSFAKRLLKAQEQVLAESPAVHSCPLDLDELNARLAQVSNGNKSPSATRPQRRCPPTEPIDEEEYLADMRGEETEAYNDLVSDNGRPVYPISLLEQVSRDPDKYREMLWPFWECPTYSTPWIVYQKQLKRWQAFRNWQNDNRGFKLDKDDEYSAYVEKQRRRCIRMGNKRGYAEKLAGIEADPECYRSLWEDDEHYMRRWQRRWQREPDCNDFSDYQDAVKRRLDRHGFTRPFQLHEDQKQQDPWTTWVEYLCFEYWWLDRHNKTIERLQPDHDKRWQELVDLKMLMPHETKEFIRSHNIFKNDGRKYDQLREAKEAAESEAKKVYLLTQEDPRRLEIPEARRIKFLQDVRERLEVAKEQWDFARRREVMIARFFQDTTDHQTTKKNAAWHTVLMQWILDQFPLIEADLQLKKTASKPEAAGSRKRIACEDDSLEESRKRQKKPEEAGSRKRRIACEDDGLESRKRQKGAPEGNPSAVPDGRPGSQDETQGRTPDSSPAQAKAGEKVAKAGTEMAPVRLRRSARIAARQAASGTTAGTRGRPASSTAATRKVRPALQATSETAAQTQGRPGLRSRLQTVAESPSSVAGQTGRGVVKTKKRTPRGLR